MFQVIEFIAVVTAATYGIIEARAARMDPLGVITVAFAVAFGGGTLRDDHVMGPMVAIGKGVKAPWPKPGQLSLSEVVTENSF